MAGYEGAFFDFSTPVILQWEEDAIRSAASTGNLDFSDHAVTQAIDRSISLKIVPGLVIHGTATDKDLPGNTDSHHPGIAFFGFENRRRGILVKVGAVYTYLVVTLHDKRT
ncbi:MAG TPA: hypothetical protein VMW12_05140 [Candidatus Dormibacteraeota bacterium]|nr:hypothetical protein [Candidatus Dormibacteraeota bacterium]